MKKPNSTQVGEFIGSALTGILWLGIIGFLIFPSLENKTTCSDVEIPFKTINQENPNSEVGDDSIETYGSNGIKEVCSDKNGVVKSETVTTQKQDELVSVGIKQPEPEPTPEPTYYYDDYNERSGAECNDGTYSDATGRGACSHHDGVYRWLN